MQSHAVDSRYAWTPPRRRAGADDDRQQRACTSSPVVLPAVQAEFGVARADASLPYTLLMIGFGIGGILMGRLADRFGVMVPLLIGAVGLGARLRRRRPGGSIWTFALAHGVLIGLLGSSATLRAAGRRHLALVRAPARHRGRDLRQRQLPRRRDLAADRAALRRERRLAPDLHRHGRLLRRRRCRRSRCCMRAPAAAARRRGRAGAGAPAPSSAAVRPVAARRRRRCCASPASRAAWRCRCRRCTSSPTAATSATAPRAARRCCR